MRLRLRANFSAVARPGIGGWLVVFTGVYVMAFCAWLIGRWGGPANAAVISDASFLPMSLVAAICSFRASRRQRADRRTAQAWRLIGISYLCYWAGDVGWFYFDAVRGSRPYPSIADVGYLSFYPFLAAGLLRLPEARRSVRERTVLFMDTATVTIASFLGIWYVIIGPTIRVDAAQGSAWLARILDVAYPLGDTVVLFALAVVLLRRATAGVDTSLIVLSVGLATFVVADVIYSRMSLDGTYSDGSWVNSLWMVGQAFTIVSAHLAGRSPTGSEAHRYNARLRGRQLSRLPYLAIASALSLLVVISIEQLSSSLIELIVGVAILTAIVAIRQLVTLQENRRLLSELQHSAETDYLTGVANRSQFFASAQLAFETPHGADDAVGLLMIDVDHFKTINDTYGHAIGDTVLCQVADRISEAIRDSDLVARYGGDELVVLVQACPESTMCEIADRIARVVGDSAITCSNTTVAVTVSVGGARSNGDISLVETLARADDALYRTKRGGRNSWSMHHYLVPTIAAGG